MPLGARGKPSTKLPREGLLSRFLFCVFFQIYNQKLNNFDPRIHLLKYFYIIPAKTP